MTRAFLIALVALAVALAPAWGLARNEYDEAAAIAAAKARNPAWRLLTTRAEAAGLRAEGAAWFENPELRIGDLSTRSFDKHRLDELSLGLRVPLPGYGEWALASAKARLEAAKRQAKAAELGRDLVLRVRLAFSSATLGERQARLAEERAALEGELVAMTELGLRSGVAKPLNLARARLALMKAQSEAAAFRAEARAARELLSALTGWPLDAALAPRETPPEAPRSLEHYRELAATHRPEAARERAEHDLLRARAREDWLSLIPSLRSLDVSYHLDHKDNKRADYWELGFGIRIPLFDWHLAALRADAKNETAAVDREQAGRRLAGADMERELAELHGAYAAWLAAERAEAAIRRDFGRALEERAAPLFEGVERWELKRVLSEAAEVSLARLADYERARLKLDAALGLSELME